MRIVSAYKARTNFGELLNEIYYRGEEVIVEKMGKPVAKIIPFRIEEKASNPFLAAAGSWKDIEAKKMIKAIFRARKDTTSKKRFLLFS